MMRIKMNKRKIIFSCFMLAIALPLNFLYLNIEFQVRQELSKWRFKSASQIIPIQSGSCRRVKIFAELTSEQERLKEILDDPEAEIEDQEFLVKAILDPLLKIDDSYKKKYEQKAKQLLVKIYQERLQGKRSKLPAGIWQGEQGKINGGILIRYVIEEKEGWIINEQLPGRTTRWQQWFRDIKLIGMVVSAFENSQSAVFKFAYPEQFWDPDNWDKPFLWFEHEFSPKGIWSSPDYEHYRMRIVRYMIERKMGWAIDKNLPGRVENWADWFKSVGLYDMLLSTFGGSHLKAFKLVYPEHFWDPDNWDKPFLWFDHDFSPLHIWNPDNDYYIKQVIRYTIEKIAGWPINEQLLQRTRAWDDWFNEMGLGSMVDHRFKGVPLQALRFACDEEFAAGILREEDFYHVISGYGIASIVHPPTVLTGTYKSVGNVKYDFGFQYRGYLAARLSKDCGGLFTPEGVLIKIFPLVEDTSIEYINVVNNGLLWDVPEEFDRYLYFRQQGKLHLSEEEALGMVKEQLGINPFDLTLRERSALAVIVELNDIEIINQFYHNTGWGGIRALANLQVYQTAFQLSRQFPTACKELFDNYNAIYTLAQEIKTIFGEQAPGYKTNPSEFPDTFLGILRSLEYGIFGSIQEANNDILQALGDGKVSVETAKMAQEELSTILRVLKGYIDGTNMRIDRQRDLDYDVQECFCYVGIDGHEKLLRVITRPQQVKGASNGEASIRFTIEPRALTELGFRIDRSYNSELGKYVVTIDISGRNLRRIGDYHHPIQSLQFMDLANEETFANLVWAFRR